MDRSHTKGWLPRQPAGDRLGSPTYSADKDITHKNTSFRTDFPRLSMPFENDNLTGLINIMLR